MRVKKIIMVIEITKRRKILLMLMLLGILIISLAISMYNAPAAKEKPSPENLDGQPEFVIPESPVGTLGIVATLAAALGMFVIGKKRLRS